MRRIHSHICAAAYPVLEAAGVATAEDSEAASRALTPLGVPKPATK